MIDHREIGRRQPLAMNAQPLIDRGQIIEHAKGLLGAVPQIAAARHAAMSRPTQKVGIWSHGLLRGDRVRPEAPVQVAQDASARCP